jgi:predicted O-methyltransferase YrrM
MEVGVSGDGPGATPDRTGRRGGLRAAARAAARWLPPLRRLLEDRARLAGEVHELRGEVEVRDREIQELRADIGTLEAAAEDQRRRLEERRAELEELRRKAGLYPPGHFHSPVPDLKEVRARDAAIFDRPAELAGIDLRADAQLALVEELRRYAADQPFGAGTTDGLRYHYDNDYFGWGDGLVLFCMLRHLRPARVVEVGSGFSSALMLDTAERFLDPAPDLVFIEPNPDRLRGLLRDGDQDRVTLLSRPVQEVDRAVFDRLEPGDMLFIDSSHVTKIGSDVNVLLLEVVPRLRPGVHVHVHDIVWPFEYARKWIYQGRAWNEAYLLRALLVGNPRLRIEFWSSQLAACHEERVGAALPLWLRDSGTSMWLETV